MRPHRRSALALVVLLVAATTAAGCLDSMASSIGPGAWPLKLVQADLLHDRGTYGEGVTIAIVDTGIDVDHPEFAGRTISWLDLVNERREPYDDNGHGTHVAGIIGARGDLSTVWRGFYLKGVAPDAKLLIIKAIAADGKGDESRVARAINSAVANGADIIVLSLGGDSVPLLGTETEAEVNRAIRAGVFVVAAAGNAPQDGADCGVTSPATETRVIAVGAVDRDGVIGAFSCRGKDNDPSGPLGLAGGRSDPDRKPEVVAPGVEILSTWSDPANPEMRYAVASGTSQAAPYVGGAIALILSERRDLQRDGAQGGPNAVARVKEVLMTTSLKIGPLDGKGRTAHDPYYGYGLLQVKAALDAL